MKRLLDTMRRTHTPIQRERDAHIWIRTRPAWMTPEDGLAPIYTTSAWLSTGELTWGFVFMASSSLFDPGDDDHTAGLVYSFDPWFERRPERLQEVGQRIFRYHQSDEAPPLRPWEHHIYNDLVTGRARPLHQELPPSLCAGRIVFHATTVVHRACLPSGRLTGRVLPILVQRRQPPHVCVPVPHPLWPQELLQRW